MVCHLKVQGHCLTFCRLADKFSLGEAKRQQMSVDIDELIRKKEG